MSTEEFDRITIASREVVNKIDILLSGRGETFQLISLYQEFISMDENSVDFTFRLAELHYKVSQVESALALLSEIENDSIYGKQVANFKEEIKLGAAAIEAIPLQKMNEHYIVQVTINDDQLLNLMIDTGASISALTQNYFDVVQQLTHFTFIEERSINTASGSVKAELQQVETFQIKDFVLTDISFVILPYETRNDIHGLLGMNVLSQFDFTIDQEQALLYLTPRK